MGQHHTLDTGFIVSVTIGRHVGHIIERGGPWLITHRAAIYRCETFTTEDEAEDAAEWIRVRFPRLKVTIGAIAVLGEPAPLTRADLIGIVGSR